MIPRFQQTIARPVSVEGIGFLSGADIRLQFFPAPANHGITFLRTDLAHAEPIPALVEYTVPRGRRTAIESHGTCVEMIEHVMAALAGLRIDNCRVELDGIEPPGCDGSSWAYVQALLEAGSVQQGVPREMIAIPGFLSAVGDDRVASVTASPSTRPALTISYDLDYGNDSPIPAQKVSLEITPAVFLRELAYARTFLLEHEADYMRSQGYGQRITTRDLLIWGKNGVIDNELRCHDECARHKILDCVGDFALIGADLIGKVDAYRSGHLLNAEIVRRIKVARAEQAVNVRRAA